MRKALRVSCNLCTPLYVFLLFMGTSSLSSRIKLHCKEIILPTFLLWRRIVHCLLDVVAHFANTLQFFPQIFLEFIEIFGQFVDLLLCVRFSFARSIIAFHLLTHKEPFAVNNLKLEDET